MDAPLIAVVPAAGKGERVAAPVPKQYLPLRGTPMLQRTLARLLEVPQVQSVVVALAPGDTHFDTLALASDARIERVEGGQTRAESVAAALACVRRLHGDQAWALVHDAARPLVALEDVQRLIEAVFAAASPTAAGDSLREPPAGGLLAVPVGDTLKRESGGARWSELFETDDAPLEVQETVDRSGLWQAQTPQLFRAGALAAALNSAREQRARVTDEASAMERAGRRCLLVEAVQANPKVTRADDVRLAEALLAIGKSGEP